MKSKITFGKVLIAYSLLWVIVIVVVGFKLWSVCSNYQNNYEAAKAASNPDLVMEQEMGIYSSENLINLAPEFLAMISPLEYDANIQKVLDSCIEGKTLSYERDEKFTDRKPRYSIKADSKEIGTVLLAQKPESDEFGFHMCELDQASLHINMELRGVDIIAPIGADVYVNGQLLNEDYKVEENEFSSLIAKKAIEKSGVSHGTVTYRVDNLIEEPSIEVKIDGLDYDFTVAEEGHYELYTYASPELVERVTNGVIEGGRLYIKNLNNLAGFYSISPYLVYGSEAYNAISSAQQGIGWAGAPSELEIMEAELIEVQFYSDMYFTAKTHYKVHRVYRGVTYDEDMDFELLYQNVNDHWYITSFSLAK